MYIINPEGIIELIPGKEDITEIIGNITEEVYKRAEQTNALFNTFGSKYIPEEISRKIHNCANPFNNIVIDLPNLNGRNINLKVLKYGEKYLIETTKQQVGNVLGILSKIKDESF